MSLSVSVFCSWFLDSLNLCELGLNLNCCVVSNVKCRYGYISVFYFYFVNRVFQPLLYIL